MLTMGAKPFFFGVELFSYGDWCAEKQLGS